MDLEKLRMKNDREARDRADEAAKRRQRLCLSEAKEVSVHHDSRSGVYLAVAILGTSLEDLR
jgi:hypothetical protein